MKARTKFLKMFYKLPERARRELYIGFAVPYSLNVVAIEVRNNTDLGKDFLTKLGYKDDE